MVERIHGTTSAGRVPACSRPCVGSRLRNQISRATAGADSFPLQPVTGRRPVPEIPLLLFLVPRLRIAPERGKSGVGLLEKLLPAITVDVLLQDGLHGLPLFLSEFPQHGQSLFINADAGAGQGCLTTYLLDQM